MKTLPLLAAATLALLTGCATGTVLVTGPQHPPLSREQVVLYTMPPAKYEVVGLVEARSNGRYQPALDRAVAQLKREAAKVGANGILLSNPQNQPAGFTGGLFEKPRVSGQAIYVMAQ